MLDKEYFDQGYQHIFGIDEVGRGPMAGPLVAAAVCLPLDDPQLTEKLKGVRDSKDMTHRQREAASERIKEVALAWGIGSVSAAEMIEVGNMTAVTMEAMHRALKDARNRAQVPVDFLLVDYYRVPFFPPDQQASFKKGDTLYLSIAAASVLAKVFRDRLMIDYAETYPNYGFDRHKGYQTQAHRKALKQYGPCPIHRRNYAPVQKALAGLLD